MNYNKLKTKTMRMLLALLFFTVLPIAAAAQEPTWVNILTDDCFFAKESNGAIHPAIVEDGVIAVTSFAGASQERDTQFWIRTPGIIPQGTKIKVSFDYKASINALAYTETNNEPGQYVHWDAIGNPSFTTEWNTYVSKTTISAQCDGSMSYQGGWLNLFHSIAFNLSEDKDNDVTFYFTNIKFEVVEEDLTAAMLGMPFDSGKYYLQNLMAAFAGKESGWGAANTSGTQASLLKHPEYVTLHLHADGTYTMESQVSSGGTSYFFDGSYMDQSSPMNLKIKKGKFLGWQDAEETIPIYTYYVYSAENGNYFGWDGSSTVLADNLAADNPNAVWLIVSEQDRLDALNNASVNNPIDATFLILDHSFGRNNRNASAWQGTGLNKGGDNANMNTESYMAVFDLHQSLTGVPNGLYKVEAQAAVTFHDNGTIKGYDGNGYPVIYANYATSKFTDMVADDQLSSQSQMSASFNDGLYHVKPVYVEVINGELTIGAKSERSDIWAVWDNFELTYYGTDFDDTCDLSDVPIDNPFYAATAFLCDRTVLSGSKPDGKTDVNGKLLRSQLAKIAFRGLYLLNGRQVPETVVSDDFPTVYEDIAIPTDANEYYYQPAKALLYLEYGDGVTPFDRNRLNFEPEEEISRVNVLKALMETFNIAPDVMGTDNPFPNDPDVVSMASMNAVRMGYVRRAADLGIITTENATFRPYDDCLRGEAFLMLARIMQKIEAGEIDDPDPQDNDYFQPLNTTLATVGLGVDLPMGNFQHYTKTSFALNGLVPLTFSHTYYSYNTTLPSVFYGDRASTEEDDSYQPLGDGWSHNYHSFITVVGSIDENGSSSNMRAIVHWGGGSIDVYKSKNGQLLPESMGVYDELYKDGSDYVVKTKSQVEYHFSKQGGTGATLLYLHSIKDLNGNTLTIDYEDGQNGSKRIKSVSDGHRTLRFFYLSNTDLLCEVKDPLNRSVSFTYFDNAQTGKKQLKTFTDAEGNTTTYDYSQTAGASKLLTRIQLPKGNYIENEYDANRRLSQTVKGRNSVPTTKTSVAVAANYGSSISTESTVTVERGSQTASYGYTYNGNNVLTGMTGAEGLFVNNTYGDDEHPELPTAMENNKTNVSGITYDEKGNMTSITVVGDGTLTTTMTYDDKSNLTSVTDPKGNTTTYTYDTTGNLTKVSAPEGVTLNITVDSKGLPTTVTNAMGVQTNYEYNSYGNLTKTTLPALGLSTTAEYDDASRLVKTTDALNRSTTFVYDNNDYLTRETDAQNHSTSYGYDANGNLTTITNAKNGVTTMTYDNATDWLTSVEFAGATKGYAYNKDGTLNSYTKPDGTTLVYDYDELGRVTNDGVNSYAYDDKLRLQSVSGNGKTLTLNYDDFNRINGTSCGGHNNTYEYDDNGNRIRVNNTTYDYDGLNRMKWVKFNGKTINYTYRKDNKLDKVSYPNGMTTSFGYDDVGRLTSKTTKLSNGTVIAGYGYKLDKVGNILEQTTTEPYDDRVLANEDISYTYNAGNRITQAGDLSFTFDANGNTTKRGSEQYEWDYLDRLMKAGSTSLTYDPLGLIASYGDITFTTDPLGIGDVLSDSRSGATYIYGNGLEARVKNGQVSYYVTDVRGSVVAIVDESGNITHKYQYDEFGKVTQKEETDYNPFQYVGKYGVMYLNDHHYYMRARHYDPTIGRFLSEDPIWSTNLYPYANNNPIMGVDPRGLMTKEEADNYYNSWEQRLADDYGRNSELYNYYMYTVQEKYIEKLKQTWEGEKASMKNEVYDDLVEEFYDDPVEVLIVKRATEENQTASLNTNETVVEPVIPLVAVNKYGYKPHKNVLRKSNGIVVNNYELTKYKHPTHNIYLGKAKGPISVSCSAFEGGIDCQEYQYF